MYKRQSVDKELSEFYKYVNGKLYRRRKNEWKLYIPDSVSENLIAEIHSMYGHLGAKKCMEMLQEHFTMDKMLRKVKVHIKTCDMCQKCKDTSNQILFGGTKAFTPLGRGELLSADYYGPLPTACLLYTSRCV